MRTAWGRFGLRMSGMGRHPADKQPWWEDRLTIPTALGVLPPGGKPTGRPETFEAMEILRTSSADFDHERGRGVATCSRSRSEGSAPTLIGTRLFRMHLKHGMRTFEGAFHSSPDCALGHGWSELEADLPFITEQAQLLRERHAAKEARSHASDR